MFFSDYVAKFLFSRFLFFFFTFFVVSAALEISYSFCFFKVFSALIV